MTWQLEKVQMCCLDFFPCVLFQILLYIFLKYLKTGKQHLDFIKYNGSIPTCGFTLEPGMSSSLNRYFSKIIRLPRIHAHDIWMQSTL